jgi:hypothetical protein
MTFPGRFDHASYEAREASTGLSRSDRNQPATLRLIRHLDGAGQNVMKKLSGFRPRFRRNDVIRIVALVSVVAFPLIADAQFGPVTRAVKLSPDAAPAAATVKVASHDLCADQHWPYFSGGCLRGSSEAIQPRLVSMNAEATRNSALAAPSAGTARTLDAARGHTSSVKTAKTVRPQTATRVRERRNPNVGYAMNAQAGSDSPAGW